MTHHMGVRRPIAATTGRALSAVGVVGLVLALLAVTVLSRAAQSPVGLHTATSFAVLAGETITNTGSTTITGDIGLDPGTAVDGYASITHSGELHIANAVANQAKTDLVTAYNDAAGRTPATEIGTELGGQILQAGVYNSASGTFGLTGTVTLDAAGDPNAVFIFQMESTLITASVSVVNLINGANPCNVFWQVGSSATLGTGTLFKGNILALTSISLTNGAQIEGRALARNGAVTMDTNTINAGACTAAATPAGTPTATPAGTPTATPAGTPTVAPNATSTATPAASSTPVPDGQSPTSTATPTPSPGLVALVTSSPTPTGGTRTTGVAPTSTPNIEIAIGEDLPNSGAPIGIMVLASLALIVTGEVMRRRATKATSRYEAFDQSNS